MIDKYWNREQAKMLQAIACIGVIIHHVTQKITIYGEIYIGGINIFNSLGILFTSIFFFFSGYGLIISLRTKDNYLKNFLQHRLPVILVPFFVTNIINVLVRIFYNHIEMNRTEIIKCLLGIVLINGNSWYIVEIFILYLLFYFIFKNIKNQDAAIIVMCVVTGALIYIGYIGGHSECELGDIWFKGEWWYNSTVTFAFGIIVARFKAELENCLNKHYKFILAVTGFLFIVAFKIEEYILLKYGYYREYSKGEINPQFVSFVVQSILCIIFILLILLINMKLTINNRVLKVIGMISTELYLIHGIFIQRILDFEKLNNVAAYAIVFVCGICSAAIVYLIDKLIIIFFNWISNKNQSKRFYTKVEMRKRIIRNLVGMIVIITVIFGGIKAYEIVIRAQMEYKDELIQLSNAQIGDNVLFGRFETDYSKMGKERVCWIVLAKDKDRLLLVTQKGIYGSSYNQRHKEVNWQESDVYSLLNNEIYDQLYGFRLIIDRKVNLINE